MKIQQPWNFLMYSGWIMNKFRQIRNFFVVYEMPFAYVNDIKLCLNKEKTCRAWFGKIWYF